MKRFDVVIMGGGLAGLTSALHLRKELPQLSIAVIEPSTRPLPDACFKVGESSVEIGAHFFSEVLGLEVHLEERQLVGLRDFVGDGHLPVSERRELGPSEQPVVPSYQLDRGRLEADLRGMVEQAGITLMEGASVFQIELADEGEHQIQVAHKDAGKESVAARWLVDATGRRRLLENKLGLSVDPHHHHHSSSWFRVSTRVNVADLVPETEHRWHGRDLDGRRWLSTSHEQHARFRAVHRRFHELNQKAQKILEAWAALAPGMANRAALRKGLSKIVRDMDRCLPKQEMGAAPLRDLIEQAIGRPLVLAESA